jgi:ACS family hexuronate transporter-like MFS transporter
MPSASETRPDIPRQATGLLHRSLIWWPSAVMMACSLLSYIDRQILAVLSPLILADTHMNTQTYGEIVSAFSIAYTVANPLWGAILDRIGVRMGMVLAVAIWTAASGAHAVTSGFAGFAAARAVLGFGEGATFPGGLRTAMDSLPPEKRSRGIALAYSGGSLGALLTPLLVTPVAVAFGWRAAFWLTAVAGAGWIVLWRSTVRFASSTRAGQFTLPNVFEKRFWMLVISYALGALPLAPILYLAPLYLTRVEGFTQAALGRVLWIPPLGWEIGYFVWGWLADRYAAENRRPAWLFGLMAVLGLPLTAVTLVDGAAAVLAILFWSMFVGAGFLVVSLRTAALWYPREQTALVAGIGAGSWSALVALTLPAFGRLFDAGDYSQAFVAVGVTPVIGTALWWLLAREK